LLAGSMAKLDDSKGQPDAARLEKAREFARSVMAQFDERGEVAAGRPCIA